MRLVPYAEEHVAATQAWLDDPAILANTPTPDPLPDNHAARWVGITAWAVLDDADEVIGFGCAPHVDLVRGEAELGYMVAASARGRGVATWILNELTSWAFAQGIHRILLLISHDNVGSQAVARSCGYQLEGTQRESYLKPGVRVNTTMWSRLATDKPLGQPGGSGVPSHP